MKRYCTLLFFLLFANFANARNEEGSKTSDKPACTKPVVLVSPKKQTLCYGTSTSFTYTASSSTPGLTYQWYGLLSDTTSNFSSSIIAGAVSSQYKPEVPSLTGTYYLAVITKNQECADTSYVSIILEAMPEKITNRTLCDGQTIKLSVTGSGAGTIYSWTPNGETDSTITVSSAGTYTCTTTGPSGCLEAFTWNINYNSNPVVSITGSPFICSGLATSLSASGGTSYEWTKQGSTTVLSTSATLPDIFAAGTYLVKVTNVNNCSSILAKNVQDVNSPNAGIDTLVCSPNTIVQLASIVSGGTWTSASQNPVGVQIGATSGLVSGMSVDGRYFFVLTNNSTSCRDTILVERRDCTKGRIGNYVWNDINNNGIQDDGFVGVANVGLELYKGGVLQNTTTSDATGFYSFENLESGNYQVKAATLPNNYILTAQHDAGSDDTIDSDFDPNTLMSQSITIDVSTTGVLKHNLTVDLGVLNSCVKPYAGKDTTLCEGTSSFDLKDAGIQEKWIVAIGNTANIDANTGTVTGLSASGDYSFILYYTLGGLSCSDTVKITIHTIPDVAAMGGNASCTSPNVTLSSVVNPFGGTYQWTGPNGFVSNLKNPVVSAIGNYNLVYTINGCSSSSVANVVGDITVPFAGADTSICATETSINLKDATSNESWYIVAGNPAVATIDASSGLVSGMNTVGFYQFILKNTTNFCVDTIKVEVKTCPINCTKPNAGTDQVLACANAATNQLTTSTTLTGIPTGGTWAVSSQPVGASAIVSNAGAVSGMSLAGDYQFVYSVGGCSDTLKVQVETCVGCVKPNAGADVSICEPATTAKLTAQSTGGAWTVSSSNPASTIIDANGNISGITANGVYQYIYSVSSGGQVCSDTAIVTRRIKPTVSVVSKICNTQGTLYTVSFVETPDAIISNNKGIFTGSTITNIPSGETVKISVELDGCTDSVLVTQNCQIPTGSISSIIWADLNDNGIQDEPAGSGIAKVIMELYKFGSATPLAIDTTDANGYYNFSNLESGEYQIKLVTTSLPGIYMLSYKKNVGPDDYINSDIDFLSGLSPVITIDVLGQGQIKNNTSIGAALVRLCITPIVIDAKAIPATCTNGTITQNAGFRINAIGVDRFSFATSIDSLAIYSKSILIDSTGITSTNTIPNPISPQGQLYYVRMYSGGSDWFADTTILVPRIECTTTCTQPNAGADQVLACTNNQLTTSTSLTGLPTGGIWSVGSQPLGASTIVSNAGVVNGMSLAGDYQFVYSLGTCKDTVIVKVESCSICIKPNAGADINICSSTNTYNLADAKANEEWRSLGLNPINVAIDAKTGLISGMNDNGVYGFILKDTTFGNTCSDTMFIFRGVAPRLSYRTCDTLTISSYPNVVWTPLASNPAIASIDAEGHVIGMSAVGIYKFSGTNGVCTEIISIEKQDCATTSVDVSLSQFQNSGICEHKIGDIIDFTVVVRRNDSNSITAMGISIKDSVSAGLSLMSSLVTKGSYNSNTGIWSGLSLAKGDSAILTLSLKVTGTIKNGVLCNTAWLETMDNIDIDSQAGDKNTAEDDYAAACISIPYKICPDRGESVVLTAPVGSTYQWQLNGQNIQGANAATYKATATGNYTVLVDNVSGCGAGYCCPFIVQEFCPCDSTIAICVPMTIKRTR